MGRRSTVEEFITKANIIHEFKYDYSKAVYYNQKSQVTILCPEHGEFIQKAQNHLHGHGCSICGKGSSISERTKGKTHWIASAIKHHGNTYDYSLVSEDVKGSSKVTIICQEHGEFTQGLREHSMGFGCTKCGYRAGAEKLLLPLAEFKIRCTLVHANDYTYEKTIMVAGNEKIVITCKVHGDFTQGKFDHLNGHGCPECSKSKISWQNISDNPTTLYYIKLSSGIYKIGITKNSIGQRFGAKLSYRVIAEQKFRTGYIAYMFEQHILKTFAEFRYKGPPILESGNSELFTKDVLCLDKS